MFYIDVQILISHIFFALKINMRHFFHVCLQFLFGRNNISIATPAQTRNNLQVREKRQFYNYFLSSFGFCSILGIIKYFSEIPHYRLS